MCLIHSVGNSARGSSQCWHAAVQNFLLRICFRPLWNKFKAKKVQENRRKHLHNASAQLSENKQAFLDSRRSKYCSISRGSGPTDLEDRDK